MNGDDLDSEGRGEIGTLCDQLLQTPQPSAKAFQEGIEQ